MPRTFLYCVFSLLRLRRQERGHRAPPEPHRAHQPMTSWSVSARLLNVTVSGMITLARWTTRTFDHELPLELYPAVLERLRGTPARAAELLQAVPEALRSWRSEPSWSAQQHIGHLDDLHDLDLRRLNDYATGAAVLSAADMTNRKTEDAGHNVTSTAVLLERLRAHRTELAE